MKTLFSDKSLNRLVPPSLKGRNELRRHMIIGLLLLGFCFLGFILSYLSARGELFYYDGAGEVKKMFPGVKIAGLNEVLRLKLYGVLLYIIYLIVMSIAYYRSFFTGTKSIYVMRRLADGGETARRCLGITGICAAAELILAAVMVGICILIYYTATPSQCLPEFTGISIWNLFLF